MMLDILEEKKFGQSFWKFSTENTLLLFGQTGYSAQICISCLKNVTIVKASKMRNILVQETFSRKF